MFQVQNSLLNTVYHAPSVCHVGTAPNCKRTSHRNRCDRRIRRHNFCFASLPYFRVL